MRVSRHPYAALRRQRIVPPPGVRGVALDIARIVCAIGSPQSTVAPVSMFALK